MQSPFSALLLAGGHSIRMGQDKAMLKVNEEPLWKYQAKKLQNIGASEVMISRRHGQAPLGADLKVVFDLNDDLGPMGGVFAGLKECKNNRLLVLAVDLPRISERVLSSLVQASTDQCGSVYQENGFFEPLVACYVKRYILDVESALIQKEKSLQLLLKKWGREESLKVLSKEAFLGVEFQNINTPVEWEAIEPDL